MIVRDEEQFLDACLSSACAVADEICLADTGSADRTLEIARAYGAKTRQIPWTNDFSEARNASLEMATRAWVLVLDADELLEPRNLELVHAVVRSHPQRIGFNLLCVNDVDEHHGGGEMTHQILRLFPNHPDFRFVQPLHEYVYDPQSTLPGGVIKAHTLNVTVRHRGYLKSVVEQRNKFQRNFEIAKAATERHPDDALHWYGLGQTYGFAGRRSEAREPLERMRACITSDDRRGVIVHGLAFLAEVYTGEGELEKAEECARDALRRSPGYPNAYFSLARALGQQGRVEDAIEAFRLAAESEGSAKRFAVVDDQIYVWKARTDLGIFLAEQGRFDEGIAELEKAVERAPDVMTPRVNLAHVLERAGRLEDAERRFHEAFERHAVLEAALQYVNFLLRQGRRGDARSFVESAATRVHVDRERDALLDVKAQLCALEAAGAIERLTADVSAALPLSPEAGLRAAIGEAVQGNRWAEAAGLLSLLTSTGVEEDRLRALCASRLDGADPRRAGLIAALGARPADHLVAVAEAVCRAEGAICAEQLQAVVAMLAAHLLQIGRHADAVRVADTALAVRP